MGGGDGAAARIALAVNADSMATWFTGVFTALDGVLFDIRIEDQDHSARLLREGAGITRHSACGGRGASLAWNPDDALQDMLVRKAFRRNITRAVHFVPTAEGFGAAVRAGLGWGMYPQQLAAPALAVGTFVQVTDVYLDVPLYWQCWKLNSPLVISITDTVQSAAAGLRRRQK